MKFFVDFMGELAKYLVLPIALAVIIAAAVVLVREWILPSSTVSPVNDEKTDEIERV